MLSSGLRPALLAARSLSMQRELLQHGVRCSRSLSGGATNGLTKPLLYCGQRRRAVSCATTQDGPTRLMQHQATAAVCAARSPNCTHMHSPHSVSGPKYIGSFDGAAACTSGARPPHTAHWQGVGFTLHQRSIYHTRRPNSTAAASRSKRTTITTTSQQSQPASSADSAYSRAGVAVSLSSGDSGTASSADAESDGYIDDAMLWEDMESKRPTKLELADERVIRNGWAATKAEQTYWTAQGMRLKRSVAVSAVQQLDPQWRCGVPYERMGGTLVESRKRVPAETGNAPSGSMWFRRAKTRDPFAVALIRVGAFYECVGYDAAMLMEYASFNPMGGVRSEIPRAGCPERQIHDVLRQLTEHAGLSVAVWEEGPDTKAHGESRKEQKSRHFAQLVTPENPVYLYDFTESTVDSTAEVPDIKGVSLSSRGYSLFVFNRNSNVVSVFNNISQESVRTLVAADRSDKPIVHLCWPLAKSVPNQISTTASQLEKDYVILLRHLTADNVTVKPYQSENPLAEFMHRLKLALQWPADRDIGILPAWDASIGWPGVRPMYYTTLAQLGLVYSPGMPSLADYMLPVRSGKVVRAVLRGLLINPPPYDVAAATRRVARRLGSMEQPGPQECFPKFDVSGKVTPAKVELVLDAAKGNDAFFRNLRGALEPAIEEMCTSEPVLSQLAVDIWPLLCHTMGCAQEALDRDEVLQAAQVAVTAIIKVVADAPNRSSDSDTSSDDTEEQNRSTTSTSYATPKQAFDRLVAGMEHYRKRVKPDVIKEESLQADTAYYGLLTVLDGLVHTLATGAQQAGLKLSPKDLPRVHVDATNLSAWVTLPSAELRKYWKSRSFKVVVSPDAVSESPNKLYRESAAPEQLLHHPYDRNGSLLKNEKVFSCPLLDQKLREYRDAVAAANEAATQKLQELAEQLSHTKLQIAAAVQLGILLGALYEHRIAADEAGWSVPVVGRQEQLEAGIELCETDTCEQQYGVMQLKGLRPYWLSPRALDKPVSNDVHLQGFDLLTGPNMAGKSTWLRSIAAAAVAGSAGLAIPADLGSALPEFDAIILRTFSGDAPDEQLSAFGVEMEQMKHVLADVRPGSLVLIDELGKGTDVASGTALAAAILEDLLKSGARGVFATHLHGLVHLMSGTPRLTFHSMGVAEVPAAGGHVRLVPTRQLVPGACDQSLALDVARDMGLPSSVLQLAQSEHQRLEQMGGYRALIKITAGGSDSNGVMVEAVSATAASTASSRADAAVKSTDGQSSVDTSSNGSSSISSGRRRRKSAQKQRSNTVAM